MSNFPQYATSYGEDHGYNSRSGCNNSEFRNRYLNPVYRTPTIRNGTREEFAPRRNPYGPFDGMSAQQRPQTVPVSTGNQIMQSQPQYSPSRQQQSFSQTQPMRADQPYDGYLPTSYNVVAQRPRTPPLRRPGLTRDFQESQQNFGKYSTSRRLPERERLRYHVPGYMGFVKNIQFLHGDTYGKTTRKCILAPGVPDY